VTYQRELETIFFKSWLWAGHVEPESRTAGDYFLYTIAEESVIVVRGPDGSIRGLINSCRHRGSRVCEKARATARPSCARTTAGCTAPTARCAARATWSRARVRQGNHG
jgi:hypothetical protein